MQQLDLLTRRESIAPKSIDEKARTVRVVWSTGAPVQRRDYEGPYTEILSLDPKHARLDKLVGASVLDSHKQWDLRNVLGVVLDAGVTGKEGWAEIKFSSRSEVEPIWQDVRDGIIRAVSVGYSVDKWEDSKDPTTGARTRKAVSWTPREISFVAMPADAGATVRKEETMTTETGAAAASTTTAQPAAIIDRAQTNQQIRTIATAAGLDAAFADGLIDRNATIEQARSAAFDELVKRGGGTIQTQRVQIGQSGDDPDVRLHRMTEALVCRISPANKPSDAARPYMQRSLLEMACELLQLRGERVSPLWSKDEILKRAMHTTTDFPNLLTATGNRVLMQAFEAAGTPLKRLARQTTIVDFRAKTTLKLSGMGKLSKVNEHGEIKSLTRSEAKEAYGLATYAGIFSLSRNAIINDDLSAFQDAAVAEGQAAAQTEADVLVALFTANSGAGVTMDDTNPLFHTAHGNVAGSGGAISTTTLSAGRVAMRAQTGVDAKTLISVVPKTLLVSPAKETEAETVLATLYPATTANVNPFQGKLDLMVEPRFSGNRWYIFADPAMAPVIEYAYLTSAPGPQIASREGWDVLGMEFRVVLDFGAGAIDHRGAYSNPGA